MGDKSKIEWLNGGASWNPITGCDPISEGCENCYAARMASRLAGRFGYPAERPFQVTFHENVLNKPLSWEQPRLVFVCSMGDLFHWTVKDKWINSVFDVIQKANWHTYLILTKRPEKMRDYLNDWYGYDYMTDTYAEPFRNVWLGVTVENHARAIERIPTLLEIPAEKHFISVEPMLKEIRLDLITFPDGDIKNVLTRGNIVPPWEGRRLDWVICGAETGPRKRPMEDAWAESLREQCDVAGVPFFFKKDSRGAGSLNGTVYHNYPVEGTQ